MPTLPPLPRSQVRSSLASNKEGNNNNLKLSSAAVLYYNSARLLRSTRARGQEDECCGQENQAPGERAASNGLKSSFALVSLEQVIDKTGIKAPAQVVIAVQKKIYSTRQLKQISWEPFVSCLMLILGIFFLTNIPVGPCIEASLRTRSPMLGGRERKGKAAMGGIENSVKTGEGATGTETDILPRVRNFIGKTPCSAILHRFMRIEIPFQCILHHLLK